MFKIVQESLLFSAVQNLRCPRNYAGDVWWDGTMFGFVRIIDCPHKAVGKEFTLKVVKYVVMVNIL